MKYYGSVGRTTPSRCGRAAPRITDRLYRGRDLTAEGIRERHQLERDRGTNTSSDDGALPAAGTSRAPTSPRTRTPRTAVDQVLRAASEAEQELSSGYDRGLGIALPRPDRSQSRGLDDEAILDTSGSSARTGPLGSLINRVLNDAIEDISLTSKNFIVANPGGP
jgi:hypothetical protein